MGWRQKLQIARNRAGLSQADLGKLVGVTGQAVNRYENENADPPASRFAALAVACGVSPSWLIDDAMPDEPPSGDDALLAALVARLGPSEVVRRVLDAEPRAPRTITVEALPTNPLDAAPEAPAQPPKRKASG